jgi:hypothetical protein
LVQSANELEEVIVTAQFPPCERRITISNTPPVQRLRPQDGSVTGDMTLLQHFYTTFPTLDILGSEEQHSFGWVDWGRTDKEPFGRHGRLEWRSHDLQLLSSPSSMI